MWNPNGSNGMTDSREIASPPYRTNKTQLWFNGASWSAGNTLPWSANERYASGC